jgi:purine-binding chemotaxis protein CheW
MPLMLASTVEAADEDRTAQYLTFALGGESFGVPIERVREILEYVEPTPIPMMPPFLRGVINLRGAVVPVIDLQSRFGKGTTEAEHRSCIVIVEIEHDGLTQPLGILVDAVSEVVAIDRSRLEARPSFGARIRPDFVEGILRLEKHFVITLDLKQVLSIEELATLIGMASGSRKN